MCRGSEKDQCLLVNSVCNELILQYKFGMLFCTHQVCHFTHLERTKRFLFKLRNILSFYCLLINKDFITGIITRTICYFQNHTPNGLTYETDIQKNLHLHPQLYLHWY